MLRIAENIYADILSPYEIYGDSMYLVASDLYEDQTLYNDNYFIVFQNLSNCDTIEDIYTPPNIGMSYNNNKVFTVIEL